MGFEIKGNQMKNSLMVRLFVVAVFVFGVQSAIFAGGSAASVRPSFIQRAKGFFSGILSRSSQPAKPVVATSRTPREVPAQIVQPRQATRTESFSEAMKSREENQGLAPHESALKYLPKLPKEKGLSIIDSSKINTDRFNKTPEQIREAAVKAVPPRPARPPLPSQPKRPDRHNNH